MSKIQAKRQERELLELTRQPGNDTCADCSARAPRWASINNGVFLCVRCAGIHRKMGTHVSKVKSLSHDTWSKDQVAIMRETGNIKTNSYLNSQRVPPPIGIEGDGDHAIERYIRQKYEQKLWVIDTQSLRLHRGSSSTLSMKSNSSSLASTPTSSIFSTPSMSYSSTSSTSSRTFSYNSGNGQVVSSPTFISQKTQQGSLIRNDHGVAVTEFFTI